MKVNTKEIALCALILALVSAVLFLGFSAFYITALFVFYFGSTGLMFLANYWNVQITR